MRWFHEPQVEIGEDVGVVEQYRFIAVKQRTCFQQPSAGVEQSVAFVANGTGCTGGQHRSVYCAAAMAARLREKFAGQPIAVTETHREQPSLRP